MQRYFITADQIDLETNRMILRGDEWHHISRVMRFAVGDRFWCADNSGKEYWCELIQVSPQQGTAAILHARRGDREPLRRITLAQSVLKGEKMDWVVQKATELGGDAVLPFFSERTVVRLSPEREEKRRERWQRIAKEAAEQSQRTHLPPVARALSWSQLLLQAKEYDLSLLAYEGESASLRVALDEAAPWHTLLLAVGPEGGFAPQEVEEALASGFRAISLGRRILRAETAGMAALAAILFYYGE